MRPHRGSFIITGGSGFLATRLAALLAKENDVILTGRLPPHSGPVHLEWIEEPMEDLAGAAERIARANVDVVINCAAVTDPDRCANDTDTTETINGRWPGLLAQAMAKDSDSRLIHISTDAVFDGKRGYYAENDECRPISAYGRSKRQGEVGVLSGLDRSVVIRTNFIGWHPRGRGFVNAVVSAARRGQRFFGFTDYVTSSIHVDALCVALKQVALSPVTGVLHLAALDPASKAEQASLLLELLGYSQDVLVRQPAPARTDRPEGRYDLSLSTELATESLGLDLLSTQMSMYMAAAEVDGSSSWPHAKGV